MSLIWTLNFYLPYCCKNCRKNQVENFTGGRSQSLETAISWLSLSQSLKLSKMLTQLGLQVDMQPVFEGSFLSCRMLGKCQTVKNAASDCSPFRRSTNQSGFATASLDLWEWVGWTCLCTVVLHRRHFVQVSSWCWAVKLRPFGCH